MSGYSNIHLTLTHAVTRYDRTRRTPQNPYAIGIYLQAVDRAVAEISKGATIEEACKEQFNGPLLAYILKFVAKHYQH